MKPSKRIGPRYEEKEDVFSRAASETKKKPTCTPNTRVEEAQRSDKVNVAEGRRETDQCGSMPRGQRAFKKFSSHL